MTEKSNLLKAEIRSWNLSLPEKMEGITLGDETWIPGDVVSICKARGIEDVAAWLNPDFRSFMPDPLVLPRMKEFSERLAKAVWTSERIALFGDYDVDGATSVSQIHHWYSELTGVEPRIYIPDRKKEGYGPNEGAMKILASEGHSLVIIQDSGTGRAAMGPISKARELGMDVLVLDHHEAPEDGALPDAILVNPKMPDSKSAGLDYLCTAGLTFLSLVATGRLLREQGFFKDRKEPDLRLLLGLVSLGTVSDVVPLKGLNRAYVRLGVHRSDANPGLHALMTVTGREEPTAYNCGFVWGPCINAGGRLGDTSRGARLLSSRDPDFCEFMAKELKEVNEERKAVQSRIIDQAIAMLRDEPDLEREDRVVVLYREDWNPGVIGVAAGKLKDRLERSVVFIGEGGKGSARAISGFNIGQAFIRATERGLLIRGGGHSAAAGLTIDPSRLEEFKVFLDEASRGVKIKPGEIEACYGLEEVGLPLVRAFAWMGPFGIGNPMPRVMIKDGVAERVNQMKGRHLKFRLTQPDRSDVPGIDVVAFDVVDLPLGEVIKSVEGRRIHVIGKLSEENWNGRFEVRMTLEDLVFA